MYSNSNCPKFRFTFLRVYKCTFFFRAGEFSNGRETTGN
ncbi:hypothetical protein ASZ90_003224 [hydrocarbon metagenome]|uniref:Uncharacterized protein n=1 Tax=hydrocarbon metagenome TaxID=938273 RepID=A0A0W8G1C9_9ZZZZ